MFTLTTGQGESLLTSIQQPNDIYNVNNINSVDNVYHQTMFTPTMGQDESLSTSINLLVTCLVHMAPINKPNPIQQFKTSFFPAYLVPVEFTGLVVC